MKGKTKYQTRGEELRALVSLDDSSPLHSRALRNRLQHFDERLEDWLAMLQSGAHLGDLCIDSNIFVNGKRVYGLREFLSQEMIYVFQGEKFSIEPMAAAVRELIAKINALPKHRLFRL
jgi:hypothetical protein